MRGKGRSEEPPALDELVMIANPSSPAAEAYRTLRTNIQLGSGDGTPMSVLVTASNASDPKTSTIANLAVAAAQGGARVVLIDADLRRPRLHTVFGLGNGSGLATILNRGDVDDIPAQATRVPGLRVLTSGAVPVNPVDLLSSPCLGTLVDALKEEADLVMLDSPPAGSLADASIVAGSVDGVILVIDARRTRRDDALRAKEQLERVHAHFMGVVLSNARVDTSAYRY